MQPETTRVSRWNRLFAIGCILAFLLTIALAAFPQWHERLHKLGTAEHACAATLVSAGSCVHLIEPAPSISHHVLPQAFVLPFAPKLTVIRRSESFVLEHAPPRFS